MIIIIPIGSMYGIYANIYHQYTPNVSIYIPAPWILWDSSGEGNLCLIHPGRAARAQKDPGLLQLRRSRRRELDSFFSMRWISWDATGSGVFTDWNRLIQIQKKGPKHMGHMGQGEPGWADISRFDKMAWWILFHVQGQLPRRGPGLQEVPVEVWRSLEEYNSLLNTVVYLANQCKQWNFKQTFNHHM